MNLHLVEGLLLRLVAHVTGARVTSWVRTPKRNAEVGGHPQSFHLWGGAIDVGTETSPEIRAVLRKVAKEVDETATRNHWHYQVDGRGAAVLAAMGALCVAWWAMAREKGGR